VNTHGEGTPPEGPLGDQPEHFEFTAENLERAKSHIAKYPAGRQQSAVLPLLDLAQRQSGGWLPLAAMHAVGDMLGMPHIRVYEVATFYTMFNLRPVGRYLLQACTTTPCVLRGSDAVVAACEKKLGVGIGGTSADGLFTLVEVECLGACVNAPILQVNDDFYEDIDGPATEALIDALRAGNPPPVGSMTGRGGSAPRSGRTTLTEPPQPPALQAALRPLPDPPPHAGEGQVGAGEAGEKSDAG
jgi:NADH-quinone oxidoreductase subunit E